MSKTGLAWEDVELNLLTLSFPKEFEAYFKEEHFKKSLRHVRIALLLSIFFFGIFGFLDAWVSGDGFSGHVRDANPIQTNTIFASSNILALDWVMGEKMGVDPKKNYVIQEALRFWEMPLINRNGDLTPWKPWSNLRPFTITMLDIFEEAYWLSRIASRAFASRQDKRFPPVSKWQWLFGIFQGITRLVERLFVSKT